MNRIAVATDLSARGRVAIDRAHRIAQATNASLLLLHAVDDDQPADIVEAAVARAREHLERDAHLGGTAVPHVQEVVTGDIYLALHEAAERANVDLLVVGDHRRSLVRDAFRDTTVERLTRLTTIPVLLARVPIAGSYRRALLGVEAGETAELVRVLDSFEAAGPKKLTALHAFDAAASGFMASISVPADRIEQYRKDVADTARRRLWESLDEGLRQRVRLRVEEDAPVHALQAVAAEEECDLIAVSTHARRGVLRMLLGSVSSDLIRHGTTDLLIVPRAGTG